MYNCTFPPSPPGNDGPRRVAHVGVANPLALPRVWWHLLPALPLLRQALLHTGVEVHCEAVEGQPGEGRNYSITICIQ